MRQWLDLPISAALSNIILSKNKFGLNLQLPSVKFIQCQTVLRNALKSSPNENIRSLWANTSNGMNIQYDRYQNTKQVLKAIRNEHQERLQHQLPFQGAIITFLFNNSLKKLNSTWSSVQSKMPKNIFNFTIRYLNNTLATRKNLCLWGLSPTSECSLCLQPESLLHVVAGCKAYLEQGRYTWRHNSVLHFLATSFQAVQGSILHADLPGFLSPCIITGDNLRPDLLLTTANNILYILELTVGFETNLEVNARRKREKYRPLVRDLAAAYREVKIVNLSISSLGIFGQSCDTFMDMVKDLKIDKNHQTYIIKKITNIAIRTTYYIFCCRNKAWTSPELLSF